MNNLLTKDNIETILSRIKPFTKEDIFYIKRRPFTVKTDSLLIVIMWADRIIDIEVLCNADEYKDLEYNKNYTLSEVYREENV